MEYPFCRIMTRFLLVLGTLVLLCGVVWAQGGTGEVSGLVSDPSGAVVANVTVTLSNSATGEKRTTTTTNAGLYRFVALPVVGTYTLEMSPKGFKSVKIGNITVSVATTRNEDIKLELGSSTEQVTVEAGIQQVQTTESSISDLVDRRVWQQMPLETRDQNNFINLLAGSAQGNVALNVLNGGTDRGAAVNGTRSGTGNFLVEGFENSDQGLGGGYGGNTGGSTGGANTTISPDAIEEYRVVQHNFPAEYGTAGGFVTDTVLKSGTNQWHGSAFEYNRVQALAANSFFSNRAGVKDSLVKNQFGGSIGGPIIKDKTFFFFTTEFQRLRQASPISGNELTPDFLNFYNNGSFEAFQEGTGAYAGAGGFCESFLGGPCPGAFSNESTLGPVAANLLATQPNPLCTPGAANCTDLLNSGAMGGGLYTGGIVYPVPVFGKVTVAQSAPLNQARYTAKVDHLIGNNDKLSASYLYDGADTTAQWAGGSSTFGPDQPTTNRGENAGINWTHTFSPTILNQARMSYTRHFSDFPGSAAQNQAGIPAIFTFFDPFNGSFGNSAGVPQKFVDNRFTWKDDLSVTKGKHNFKAGAEYSRIRNGSSFQTDFNGAFAAYGILDVLSDFKFGHDSDQALFGYPYYGSWFYAEASIDPTKHPATRPDYYRGFRANEFAAYFQDDWRIHPRLTVNLGLRWDYFGPPHNFKPNIDSNFFSGAPVTPIQTASTNPFFPINNPQLGAFATGNLQVRNHEIWQKDTNNFAPRLGFSYDVTGKQTLVVRGGFGIAYDRLYNNVFENIRFNPPFFCFCNFGSFINGVVGDAITTPGVYTVPFTSQGLFNDPNLFPVLPKTSPRAIDQDLVTAYYEQTNFGFQYEIKKDFVWETNYVGTWGRKLVGIVNLNTYPGRLAFGTAGPIDNRLNTNVNNINLRTNGFSSNYNALQTSLRKRFSNGLQFDANYTYSKAMDQISDTFTPRGNASAFNPTDSLNPGLDYGPADFNIKHRFVVSYSYDLPFFKTNRWLGGWSVNGIITAQGGVPFTPNDGAGFDSNANGTFNDRLAYVGPGSITNAYISGKSPADGFFKPGSFAAVAPGAPYPYDPATAGDQVVGCPPNVNGGLWCEGASASWISRNSLIGPKYVDVDFGVVKRFKITESTGLSFQASFFNLFNHPNFTLPDFNFSDCAFDPVAGACTGTFGKSTSTFTPGQGGARVTQLALRFDF